MELNLAVKLANEVLEKLKPYCDRIEIGGSIRRKRPWVKDIEIICIPKTDDKGNRPQKFIDQVNEWEKKSGEPTGKNTKRIVPGGIMLDLFMAVPDNWGYIFVIRTGSTEHNRVVLEGIRASGHKADKGFIWRNGIMVPMKEEKDLFALFNYPVIPPEKREA